MEPTKPNSASGPFGSRATERDTAGESSRESNAEPTAGESQTTGQERGTGPSASAAGSSSVGTGGQSTPSAGSGRSGASGAAAGSEGSTTPGSTPGSTFSDSGLSGRSPRSGSNASDGGTEQTSDYVSQGMSEADAPPESSGSVSDRDRIVGGSNAYWDNEGPGPRIMAADTLEGDKVVNAAGEDLGEIMDIMIDVPTGRVAYAVLSFGGFLGMGDKLFAIPWQALQLDPENKRFILDVDRERLQSAPGFDKDHWPSMADQRWATDIHSYYGSRPYWE